MTSMSRIILLIFSGNVLKFQGVDGHDDSCFLRPVNGSYDPNLTALIVNLGGWFRYKIRQNLFGVNSVNLE